MSLQDQLRSWYYTILDNKYGLALILVTWLLFFGRTIFFGQFYFLDDLKAIYYPLEHEYAQFQHSWQLPEWSNYFGFGHPILAWGQLGFFTPLHVLLRALFVHPIILLQISIVSYFLLGALGLFVFLRKQNLPQLAAALGAVIFTFSGFNIGHLNHVNFYTGTMILPWLLVLIHYFIIRPTLGKSVLVSLAIACMALSAQPQVVLYTCIVALCIAIGLFLSNAEALKNWWRYLVPTLVVGLLAFGLSSLAILPLAEFVPITDRAGDLPVEELLEFSYAPWHTITLIFPYFYGDHFSYWGEKNFQELAAYVGIVPLLLALYALFSWSRHRSLRITGIVLVAISIIMSLGKFSPLYKYLVESHILTSLNIPGRFVLFFDCGIALLAALGLHDMFAIRTRSLKAKIGYTVAAVSLVTLLFIPLFVHGYIDQRIFENLARIVSIDHPEIWFFVIGFALSVVSVWLRKWWSPISLVAVSILFLLYAGYNYNPLLDKDIALAHSPAASSLLAYGETQGLPPRIYARDELLIADQDRAKSLVSTERIAPNFTIHQPLLVTEDNFSCVRFLVHAASNTIPVNIAIREQIAQPPLRQIIVPVYDVPTDDFMRVCFEPIKQSAQKVFYVSFGSDQPTTVNLFYYKNADMKDRASFIRVLTPTHEQIQQSVKNARIVVEADSPPTYEPDIALLNRHLQVTANASGGRWIAALSVGVYREFIEQFFANDREAVDGAGNHVIERNRTIFDLAGVTHFSHIVPADFTDAMEQAHFTRIGQYPVGSKILRLYENPQALPKAFLVRNGFFMPAADETRHAMQSPNFDPRSVVYIDGPTPPTTVASSVDTTPLRGTVQISEYKPTFVSLDVDSDVPSWLVLTDTSTPQWKTYIDGSEQPYYVANTIFKAAYVPAGKHTVSFQYESAATNLAKKLTGISLVAVFLLALFSLFQYTYAKSQVSKSLE